MCFNESGCALMRVTHQVSTTLCSGMGVQGTFRYFATHKDTWHAALCPRVATAPNHLYTHPLTHKHAGKGPCQHKVPKYVTGRLSEQPSVYLLSSVSQCLVILGLPVHSEPALPHTTLLKLFFTTPILKTSLSLLVEADWEDPMLFFH